MAVRKMRESGIPAFFSIDTGATVYVNTLPGRGPEIQGRIEEMGIRTIPCTVGGPTHLVDEPLF
jgi:phosphomevalonate decarboxylase